MKNQNNQNQGNQSVIMEAVKSLKFQSKYQKDKDCDRIKLEMHFDDLSEVSTINTGLISILSIVGRSILNDGVGEDDIQDLGSGLEAISTVLSKTNDDWCIAEQLTDIIKTPIK